MQLTSPDHALHRSILGIFIPSGFYLQLQRHDIWASCGLQRNEPLFHSSARKGEHREPVWGVRWQPGASAGGRSLVFASISSDGRLIEWALGKAELAHEVFSFHEPCPTSQEVAARGHIVF